MGIAATLSIFELDFVGSINRNFPNLYPCGCARFICHFDIINADIDCGAITNINQLKDFEYLPPKISLATAETYAELRQNRQPSLVDQFLRLVCHCLLHLPRFPRIPKDGNKSHREYDCLLGSIHEEMRKPQSKYGGHG